MTEVTPNLPHLGNFCKYCFMGTLLVDAPCFYFSMDSNRNKKCRSGFSAQSGTSDFGMGITKI